MSKPSPLKPENEVNAYLFYSQRLLQLLDSNKLIENQADKMAVTASVCLSLKQAWQAWLKELGTYTSKEISDYTDLLLPESGAHPEIQLLKDINQQPNNWLSQLVLLFEPRLNTPTLITHETEDELAADALSLRIDLVQISEEKLAESEKIKQVISDFKAYIHSVRSRQAEW